MSMSINIWAWTKKRYEQKVFNFEFLIVNLTAKLKNVCTLMAMWLVHHFCFIVMHFP